MISCNRGDEGDIRGRDGSMVLVSGWLISVSAELVEFAHVLVGLCTAHTYAYTR